MEITVSQEKGRVPVAVIKVAGQLDGQTYSKLIDKAREVYQSGAHDLLLDLSELTYISSAGLVSLHTITLMSRGEAVPDPEQGWATLKSMDRMRDGGVQAHVKLLNLQPQVMNVLDMVGFKQFFEIYTDKQTALDSF